MRDHRDDAAVLWDMLDAAQAVGDFIVSKGLEDYLRDRMLRGAVERHLEIIGEAARKVSESFKIEHPEIPWRRIIGLRNVLAHEYGEIKNEKMWDLAKNKLPDLVLALRPLIPAID